MLHDAHLVRGRAHRVLQHLSLMRQHGVVSEVSLVLSVILGVCRLIDHHGHVDENQWGNGGEFSYDDLRAPRSNHAVC